VCKHRANKANRNIGLSVRTANGRDTIFFIGRMLFILPYRPVWGQKEKESL
jgi:hypothetical protein